jgi:regulation of enolase protein 1 (concanavalin A-like superfamily)
MPEVIALPAFPAPMRWLNRAESWRVDGDDGLSITAGSGTDLFTDPGTGDRFDNAPALIGRVEGDFTLSTRVSFDGRATFDAGVLLLYGGERTWAKLCLEVSPQGRLTVVSVVTRGVSDDCNSVTVDGDAARLRLSRVGQAFAFHLGSDDGHWHLIRYFALDGEPEAGFLAQSPTGQGCTVRFAAICHVPERLRDLRDGR